MSFSVLSSSIERIDKLTAGRVNTVAKEAAKAAVSNTHPFTLQQTFFCNIFRCSSAGLAIAGPLSGSFFSRGCFPRVKLGVDLLDGVFLPTFKVSVESFSSLSDSLSSMLELSTSNTRESIYQKKKSISRVRALKSAREQQCMRAKTHVLYVPCHCQHRDHIHVDSIFRLFILVLVVVTVTCAASERLLARQATLKLELSRN